MNAKAEAKLCFLLSAHCPFYDTYFLYLLGLHLLAFPSLAQALSLGKDKRVVAVSLGHLVHFGVSAYLGQIKDWFSR